MICVEWSLWSWFDVNDTLFTKICAIFTFSFPVTLTLIFDHEFVSIVTFDQRYVPTKLEVCKALRKLEEQDR